MGLYDNDSFAAPTGLEPSIMPSLDDFLNYQEFKRRKRIDEEKDMMKFQSDLNFNNLNRNMRLQQNLNPPVKPQMNTVFMDYLNPYKQGMLDLGRDRLELQAKNNEQKNANAERKVDVAEQQANRKLDITEQNNTEKNKIATMNAETKQYLASLHNMTDSEKLKLLQEGKIDLQQLKDAAAMSRLTQQGVINERLIDKKGDIESGQIDQRGRITSNQIKERADVESKQIEQRGNEVRKTKQTPSADAGVTSGLPTQEIKARQIRANQAILQHPEWKSWITINPNNGMVEVQTPGRFSGPDENTYRQIVNTIEKGTIREPQQTPPPKQELQTNTTGDMIEMVTPDGRSTRMVPKSQMSLAKSQGYVEKK